MVLTRPVTWKVGRLLVGDCLWANSKRLVVVLAEDQPNIPSRVSTLRLISSCALGVDMVAVLASSLAFWVGSTFHVHKKFEGGAGAPRPTQPMAVDSIW
jgi:hypothetical protein